MTAKVLAPIQQLFGSAFQGYQLFTYLAGTSTKATTYKTSDGNSAHTNPIILDAIGGPAGETGIWIDPNKPLKFLLTTPTDTDPPSGSTFVYDNIVAALPAITTSTVTTNYTVALSDNRSVIELNATSGAFIVTLLAAATAGAGFEITFKKVDSTTNAITLDGNGSESIDSQTTWILNKQYEAVTLVCDGSNWQIKDRKIQLRNAAGTSILSADSTGLKLENDSPITDSSGNEYLKFSKTASAVNEITVANAATGNGPTLSATGGDANIDINYQTKGTGVNNFKGTADSAAEVRLFEDTDNGTNYIGLKAPTSISANKTFVLPSTDGTANQALVTDGSANLSFASIGAPIAMQVFTASGTYTRTSGATKALVYCTGGGGGGGGGDNSQPAAGGGAGATAIRYITSSLGSTETVTVGTGGAGGTTLVTGGTGNTSSFGTWCSATGGVGGAYNSGGPNGGTAANGTLNISGGAGGAVPAGGSTTGGQGGASFWGGGGAGGFTGGGGAGAVYGTGGGGSGRVVNSGGNGKDGVVIVFEYV